MKQHIHADCCRHYCRCSKPDAKLCIGHAIVAAEDAAALRRAEARKVKA